MNAKGYQIKKNEVTALNKMVFKNEVRNSEGN
jgi:hypothetical protein